jgi:hypothetical protein
MSPTDPGRDVLLRRVRGEYLEMPGLRLTPIQAQRLWSLDRSTCEWVLNALVETNFLVQTRDGSFARCDSWMGLTRASAPQVGSPVA